MKATLTRSTGQIRGPRYFSRYTTASPFQDPNSALRATSSREQKFYCQHLGDCFGFKLNPPIPGPSRRQSQRRKAIVLETSASTRWTQALLGPLSTLEKMRIGLRRAPVRPPKGTSMRVGIRRDWQPNPCASHASAPDRPPRRCWWRCSSRRMLPRFTSPQTRGRSTFELLHGKAAEIQNVAFLQPKPLDTPP